MNFNVEDNKANLSVRNEENIGDVQLVNSESTDLDDETIDDEEIIEDEEQIDPIEQYYTNSKLERDKMYSQMIETYQKIIDNTTISSEQKSIAINEISKLTNLKNSIMIAENLVKNKGFEDILILVNDSSTSVIVRVEQLSPENIAQIQNIVSREIGIQISNINISNKY